MYKIQMANGQVRDVESAKDAAEMMSYGGKNVTPGASPSDVPSATSSGPAVPAQPAYPKLDSLLRGDLTAPDFADGLKIKNNLDGTGYDLLKKEATSVPGQSLWEKLMMGRQDLQLQKARGDAATSNNAATAGAISNLARTGGISSGARMSVAKSGAVSGQKTLQDLLNQDQQQRLGISTKAEDTRLGNIKDLNSADLNKATYLSGVEGKNIANVLTQKNLEDAAKIGQYGEAMKAYSANQTGNAIAGGGKKV